FFIQPKRRRLSILYFRINFLPQCRSFPIRPPPSPRLRRGRVRNSDVEPRVSHYSLTECRSFLTSPATRAEHWSEVWSNAPIARSRSIKSNSSVAFQFESKPWSRDLTARTKRSRLRSHRWPRSRLTV